LSAVLWAALVGLGAYFAGPSVADFLGDLGTLVLVLIAVAALLSFAARWRWKRVRHR
jgi:membrane protein DedA with SNARE-associated domain